MKPDLIKELALTVEMCGGQAPSAAAKDLMERDLEDYDPHEVSRALARCRKEVARRLTLADIISRIDDGRPGPEQAFAMLPKGEDDTVVWTEEMAKAFNVMSDLDDRVASRMAFLEAYRQRVTESREARRPVVWTVSLGHDSSRRDGALLEAYRLGRLTAKQVDRIAPHLDVSEQMKQLPASDPHRLNAIVKSITKG